MHVHFLAPSSARIVQWSRFCNGMSAALALRDFFPLCSCPRALPIPSAVVDYPATRSCCPRRTLSLQSHADSSFQLCMLSNIDPQARGNMACVVLPFTAHMRLIVMHTEHVGFFYRAGLESQACRPSSGLVAAPQRAAVQFCDELILLSALHTQSGLFLHHPSCDLLLQISFWQT